MAEKIKSSELSEYPFDETKSALATEINSLSNQEIFERYFVASNNKQDIMAEFNDLLEIRNVSDQTKKKYLLLNSLVTGNNLSYICTGIKSAATAYMPKGYTLNTKQVFDDLEQLFNENKKVTRTAALRDTDNKGAHPYVRGILSFFKASMDKALDYADGLSL